MPKMDFSEKHYGDDKKKGKRKNKQTNQETLEYGKSLPQDFQADDDQWTGKKREKQINREMSGYEKSLLLGFQYEYAYQPQGPYRGPKPKTLSVR